MRNIGASKIKLEEYGDLLTVADMREITGLSDQTIRYQINTCQLPGCRIGKRLFVPKDEFIKYVRSHGGMSYE